MLTQKNFYKNDIKFRNKLKSKEEIKLKFEI